MYVCLFVQTILVCMYMHVAILVSSIFLCSSASSLCCLGKKNKKTKGSQLLEHFRHSTGATYLAGKVLENVKFWPSQPVESTSLTVHPLQPFMDMCAQAMLWNDSTLEHSLEHSSEHSLEHPLEHPLEHSLEHSSEHSLEHSLEHPLEHPLEHSLKHSLEHFRQFTGTAFPSWSGGTSLVVLRGHC